MLYTDGSTINLGDEVRLVSPDPSYTLGRNNPAVGTKWECTGNYVGHNHVNWKNGTSNSYKSGELENVATSAEGRCKSIWE